VAEGDSSREGRVMPACSWCGRIAVYRDNKLHFACPMHRSNLMASLRETARDHDRIAAEYARSRRQKDASDLTK
jgi:predicted RNA-binding Zn-ribbon protein involved in translation (DUF1610 family)